MVDRPAATKAFVKVSETQFLGVRRDGDAAANYCDGDPIALDF
jgi:hypothetical protein